MNDSHNWVETPDMDAYRDWHGSITLEEDILNSQSLYELAGLDRDRWTILGINVYPGCRKGAEDWVYVYAHDREDSEIGVSQEGFENLHQIATREGGIPVTSILLHDVTLADVLSTMKTGHLHFRTPGHENHRLIEKKRADYPAKEIGEA